MCSYVVASKMILHVLCLTIIMFNHVRGSNISDNTMTILRKEKLLGYDPNSRPVVDHNHNTTVYIGLSVKGIDINDHEQTMILVSYLTLMWKDEFLYWNPAEYNDISSLHFDTYEVWIPDIALYNSAKGADTVPKSGLPVLVFPDGTVYWVPPFTAEVSCLLDFTNWPSDKHTCSLQFGSWAHHGELINLKIYEHPDKTGLSFTYYQVSNRWQVLSHNSTRYGLAYGNETYHVIDFNVTVQRQAGGHTTFITQTTLALMLVVLCSYLLPLRHHLSRLLLHLMALSLLIVCNFIIFQSLPSSGVVPFVVRYFSGTIVLTTLSLLCTVGLATSLSSRDTSSSSGVKRKLVSLFGGFSRGSDSDRSQFVATNEAVYSNLEEEELKDMSANRSMESNIRVGNPPAPKSNESGIFRIINMVLFFTFSIAYFVDYIVLRSSVGK